MMRMKPPVALRAILLTVIALAYSASVEERDHGNMTFRYGFRYDPMQFVDNDQTLQGALAVNQGDP